MRVILCSVEKNKLYLYFYETIEFYFRTSSHYILVLFQLTWIINKKFNSLLVISAMHFSYSFYSTVCTSKELGLSFGLSNT